MSPKELTHLFLFGSVNTIPNPCIGKMLFLCQKYISQGYISVELLAINLNDLANLPLSKLKLDFLLNTIFAHIIITINYEVINVSSTFNGH